MSTVENEVKNRGWGSVLEELSGLAARERNAALGSEACPALNTLLETLNDATGAGRGVDALRQEGQENQ